MNANGSGPTNLSNSPGADSQADWSPNGATIAFVTDRDGTMNIWSMDENGKQLVQLTSHTDYDVRDFSLHNGKLAYQQGAVDSGPRLFTQPTCHHAPEVYGGLEEARARDLLVRFFKERR